MPGAQNKVSRLPGVTFRWRANEFEDMNFEGGSQVGLVAQEVEDVVPEVVMTAPDGYKSVAYAQLTAVLIEAVKEQQTEIDRQHTQLAQMDARMARLESALETLQAMADTPLARPFTAGIRKGEK